MKCPKCGYDNKDGANHCDLCKEILAKPLESNNPAPEGYKKIQEQSQEYNKLKTEYLWHPSEMGLIDILFSFKGRIGRKEFWLCILATFLFIGLPVIFIFGDNEAADTLIGIICLWPALAVNVKRWHDRNKSAWWLLIWLVPLIGELWALIELGFLPGTEGPNDYDV